MQKGDKRQEERIPLSLALQARRGSNSFFQSKDISISGLGIYSSQPLYKNKDLPLSLFLPLDSEPLEVQTHIAWSRRCKEKESFLFQAGMFIKDMSALDRSRWEHFIESQREQLQSIPVYWEEKGNIDRFKKNIGIYLASLGKSLLLVDKYKNPFVDFWGIEPTSRLVLVLVYEIAKKDSISQIIDGLEWFHSQSTLLQGEFGNLSLSKLPLVLIFSFYYSQEFLRTIKYLKSMTIELLKVSFIASRNNKGVLTKRITSFSQFLPEVENTENIHISIFPKEEYVETNSLPDDYSHLDRERRKIMRWLSKI